MLHGFFSNQRLPTGCHAELLFSIIQILNQAVGMKSATVRATLYRAGFSPTARASKCFSPQPRSRPTGGFRGGCGLRGDDDRSEVLAHIRERFGVSMDTFDIQTIKPIEPPLQAIKEWLSNAERISTSSTVPGCQMNLNLTASTKAQHGRQSEIHLDDGRILVLVYT